MSQPSVDQLLATIGATAAERLRQAQIALDGLGSFEPPRRRILGSRAPRIRRVGAVWPLGSLLVSEQGELFAAGQTLRAHVPKPHINYPSESARARDELRHAAIRGGFREGETVHWDAAPIVARDLTDASTPVLLRDGMPVVRWSAAAPASTARPLADYVDEQLELRIRMRNSN